ncbi:hypothetical protein DRE_01010 [Drechslerella stenobrocha 248]|uniref:Uncharacterized protein n=1 Tax=Drechslerella stenobrocha 248 TaxID=1043628 RepID=W7HLR7_9PEZI|nr:hypothetical protein DRE_01010 [Drechslerella stenobrocha 248]
MAAPRDTGKGKAQEENPTTTPLLDSEEFSQSEREALADPDFHTSMASFFADHVESSLPVGRQIAPAVSRQTLRAATNVAGPSGPNTSTPTAGATAPSVERPSTPPSSSQARGTSGAGSSAAAAGSQDPKTPTRQILPARPSRPPPPARPTSSLPITDLLDKIAAGRHNLGLGDGADLSRLGGRYHERIRDVASSLAAAISSPTQPPAPLPVVRLPPPPARVTVLPSSSPSSTVPPTGAPARPMAPMRAPRASSTASAAAVSTAPAQVVSAPGAPAGLGSAAPVVAPSASSSSTVPPSAVPVRRMASMRAPRASSTASAAAVSTAPRWSAHPGLQWALHPLRQWFPLRFLFSPPLAHRVVILHR